MATSRRPSRSTSWPGRGATTATTSLPKRSWGRPTTRQSATAGWWARACSTSSAKTFSPPVLMHDRLAAQQLDACRRPATGPDRRRPTSARRRSRGRSPPSSPDRPGSRAAPGPAGPATRPRRCRGEDVVAVLVDHHGRRLGPEPARCWRARRRRSGSPPGGPSPTSRGRRRPSARGPGRAAPASPARTGSCRRSGRGAAGAGRGRARSSSTRGRAKASPTRRRAVASSRTQGVEHLAGVEAVGRVGDDDGAARQPGAEGVPVGGAVHERGDGEGAERTGLDGPGGQLLGRPPHAEAGGRRSRPGATARPWAGRWCRRCRRCSGRRRTRWGRAAPGRRRPGPPRRRGRRGAASRGCRRRPAAAGGVAGGAGRRPRPPWPRSARGRRCRPPTASARTSAISGAVYRQLMLTAAARALPGADHPLEVVVAVEEHEGQVVVGRLPRLGRRRRRPGRCRGRRAPSPDGRCGRRPRPRSTSGPARRWRRGRGRAAAMAWWAAADRQAAAVGLVQSAFSVTVTEVILSPTSIRWATSMPPVT